MKNRYADKEFAINLGKKIRNLREEKNLKIEELYLKCDGLNQSSLSRIERGLTDPQISTLKRIADALDVPLAELLSGVQGKHRHDKDKEEV